MIGETVGNIAEGFEQMMLFCMIAVVAIAGMAVTIGVLIVTPEQAYPIEFERAEILCEKADGVKYLEYDYRNFDVYCKNGAIFENVPTWSEKWAR